MPTRINIVYANMQQNVCDAPCLSDGSLVRWSRNEDPKADIIVYHNGYSYQPRYAIGNKCRILYMYEPLVVYPRQFMRGFWESFDYVLTWCDTLAEQGGRFVKFPSLYYDFPFGAAHGVAGSPQRPANWREKRKAICQVAGNKHSLISSELYSRRREIARWFGKYGKMELDTFGTPPMPVPNYKGRSANKLETMSAYRYALCLENDAHPLWSRGYITEKIFDCFYAFAVPVYLGDADVEKHIPPDCFVDLRDFSTWDGLDAYLCAMTDKEYAGYLEAIERLLKEYDAPHVHSCTRLYEKALELASMPAVSPRKEPFGFWQKSSLIEKAECAMMTTALPLYRTVCKPRYAGT